MKEVLILEDKSETRKVLAGLVKEVHSDAVIYEAADEKTAYDIAMKRIARPEEIAEAALYMASDGGRNAFNGRHFIVSGGEYRSTPYYI